MYLILKSIPAYPTRAAKTNNMQEIIHVEIAVNPSTFGELEDTELKILIKTRNKVTRSVIRPGIICGSIRKLAYEITKQVRVAILHIHKMERATNCI